MLVAAEVVLTGWYVGFAIGFTVVLLVVVEAGIILGLARRIGVQAQNVALALDEARVHTLPLWEVSKVNDSLRATVNYAGQARTALGGGK